MFHVMVNDEADQQEIDQLVHELWEPKPAPAPKPVQPAAPARIGFAEPPVEKRRASRWTSAKILMPEARSAPSARGRFAPAFSLPSFGLPSIAWPSFPAWSRPAMAAETRNAFIVRAWVTLGVIFAASMAYWPYPKTYLVGLLLYILAAAMVLFAGLWSAKLTWDARLGGAHTISLGIVLWAIALVAAETLHAAGQG